MRTIHKQALHTIDVQQIEIPKGSTILTVREQHNIICIWYLCGTERELEYKTIYIVGTGHPLSDKAKTYLGTAILHDGQLVFHVYM
jgi:hypothetical protein